MKLMKSKRVLACYLCSVLLSLLGLLYLANGVTTLVASGFDGDLTLRWREQRYILRGIDPYDVSGRTFPALQSPASAARAERQRLDQEPKIIPSGYPPWAFLTGFLFVYPGDFRVTQWSYCALNLAVLAVTLAWIHRRATPFGRPEAALVTAALFAMFGHASTLRLGQYGILMNAALLLALAGEESGRWFRSGLGFTLAATKPNVSLLFFPLLLVRRRWLPLLTTAIYCGAASVVVWMLIDVDPLELTRQMLAQSSVTTDGDVGLLGIGVPLGVPYRILAPALGLTGVALALALSWWLRAAPPLATFACASVLGRVFFYHRQYDNVMLLMLLLGLGIIALRNRRTSSWILFGIVGLTLWAPLHLVDYTLPVRLLLIGTWLASLIPIVRHANLLSLQADS